MKRASLVLVLSAFLWSCQQSDSLVAPDSDGLTPASHGTHVLVTPADLDGWAVASGPGATAAFEHGPGTPPLGAGSVEFRTDASVMAYSPMRNIDWPLVRLAILSELEYWTHVEASPGGLAPIIILNIDLAGDGTWDLTDGLLIFDPIDQTPGFCPHNPQPAVALNVWQEWDALNGCWYFAAGEAGTGPGAGVVPMSDIIAAYPDAQIVNRFAGGGTITIGGVRIVAGLGPGPFVGNVDAFSIGYPSKFTTYDFELRLSPATKADCKGGGWDQYGFKNQGQCVKFTENGKDSR